MTYYKRSYGGKYSYPNKKSLKAKTSGQFKAAKKGQDSMNFVVNSNVCFSAQYTADGFGTAAINMWDVLCRNSNFINFKNMYDQVRIDGVKCKLTVTDATTTVQTINQVKNTNIYIGWDRTGLSSNQVNFYDDQDDKIPLSNFDSGTVESYKTIIGTGVVNMTGGEKSSLNSFQRWSKYTSCYPSIMNEKAQYVPTANIKLFNKSINWNTGEYKVADYYKETPNFILNDQNPVNPFESSAVKFKPTLVVGVFNSQINSASGDITQYGQCNPIVFNAEVSIACTFRDLKPST